MQTQAQLTTHQDSLVRPQTGALTTRQIVISIVVGLAFWFAGALAVRYGSTVGLFGPTGNLISFALAIPIAWFGVFVLKKAARLEPAQTLAGVAIGSVAATLCDGTALTWASWLYGTDPAQILYGAAWILWGAGVFLLFALYDFFRAGGKA